MYHLPRAARVPLPGSPTLAILVAAGTALAVLSPVAASAAPPAGSPAGSPAAWSDAWSAGSPAAWSGGAAPHAARSHPVVPPAAPQNLGTQLVSSTTVDLAWLPAAAGTNRIASYQVYARGPNATQPGRLITTTAGAGMFVPLSGLRPDTTYELYVYAVDTAGVRGPASAPVRVTTLPQELVPGPPVATAVTMTSATISWTAPSAGAGRIAGYDLIVPASTPTQPIQLRASTDAATTAVQLTGLRPAITYTFVVAARYTDGTVRSAPSARGTVTTVASTPPSAPSDPTVVQLTATSVTLEWTAAAPGDFPIARYITHVNGGALGDPNSGPDVLTTTFGVQPGQQYEVYIRAIDQAGVSSPPSGTVTFTAPEA